MTAMSHTPSRSAASALSTSPKRPCVMTGTSTTLRMILAERDCSVICCMPAGGMALGQFSWQPASTCSASAPAATISFASSMPSSMAR